MKSLKLFSTCMLVVASLFFFSACDKDDPIDNPQGNNPTEQDDPTTDPTGDSLEQILIGQWTVTASQESFQYEAGGPWDDATDAVVGEKFVFNADKTGWMYFEEEGAFTWVLEGTNLHIDNQGYPIEGQVTKIDNNNIKLHLEKDRYVGDITLKK